MGVSNLSLEVTTDHAVPVGPPVGGTMVILNQTGSSVLNYADDAQMSVDTGTISAGASQTFTNPVWIKSTGLSSVLVTLTDGTAGGTVTQVNGKSPDTSGHVTLAAVDVGARGVLNVKAFGAAGDGSTDDSTAIQNAINAANTAGGGTVFLPLGSYKVSGATLVPKNNVTVMGEGLGSVVLPYGTIAAFNCGTLTAGTALTGFQLLNFKIDGTNQTGAYTTQAKGMHGQFLDRCTFRDLLIYNTMATGLGIDYLRECVIDNVTVDSTGRLNNGSNPGGNGIGIGVGGWIDGTENGEEPFVVSNCHARNVKRYGIMVEKQASISTGRGGRVVGCYALGCQGGFMDAGSYGIVFEGCIASDNVGAGFVVGEGTIGINLGVHGQIVGCVSTHNGGAGIQIAAGANHTQSLEGGYLVANNTCVNNTGAGIDLSTISAGDLVSLTIANNEVEKNGGVGISVASTGTSKFAELALRNNDVGYNTGTGIKIDSDVSKGIVSGNRCYESGTGTQATGLQLVTGRTMTSVVFEGGDLAESTTPVNNAATLTTCTLNLVNGWTVAAGAPSFTAPAGTIFKRTNGTAGNRIYVNQDSATTWVAIASV